MRDFRKLAIWVKSIDFAKEMYHITADFPDAEKFGLTSQIRRSAISIPSNIAEGCARSGEMEFKRFLEIAIGSAFELESQLILSEKLGYLKVESLTHVVNELNGIQKQINQLISKIKTDQINKANG